MNIKRLVAVGSIALVGLMALTGAAGAFSTDFNTSGDTTGWFDNGGTISQVPSGFANPAYADGVTSDGGHARLNRPATCDTEPGGGGATIRCKGPYTQWGGYGDTWNGPYQTQVDIYLDAAYANDSANVDSYGGNACLLTSASDPACNGTRFDYTSAINNAEGDHLRDFGFVVGTGQPGTACAGWTVNAQTNVNRNNAFPDDASKNPACITGTGWFTFKHSFYADGNNLKVNMEILDATSTPVAQWTITSGDLIVGADAAHSVGCNRYGYFSDQEIFGLPIDNASMTGGCAGPTISQGQILATGTTCQAYDAGTALALNDGLQYTLKNGNINSVSPGVFFYYGTITGTADQTFTIDQTTVPDGAPLIPVQQRQVILYDENCNVLKWTPVSYADGVVTGTLPSTGTFILSVKYSASALEGESDPDTVTYTIDGSEVVLQEK